MNKAITTPLSVLFYILLASPMFAQCPDAAAGFHRVQKGETLYAISKKYKVSVDQICEWNNIEQTAILSICQELAIAQPTANRPAPSLRQPPASTMKVQEGGRHVIKPGETIAGIAHIYGFSEKRFRRFNGLNPTEPAWPGLVLRTSDCNCPKPNNGDALANDRQFADTLQNNGQPNGETYLTWEENVEAKKDENGLDKNGFPFGENPFYQESSIHSNYNKPGKRRNPSSYNKEMGRISPSGNQNNRPSQKPTKPMMDPQVRRSHHGHGAPDKTYIPPEEELIYKTRKESPTSYRPNNAQKASPKENTPFLENARQFMTFEEQSMVKEINLVRSNPAGYVKFIEMYKKDILSGKVPGSVAACDELIGELKKTPPLLPMKSSQCLFNAAKEHGEDLRRSGNMSHLGSDGSYPWDRIKRNCPDLTDGNENLIGGPKSVRKLVIQLLVDDKTPNRGHRRNLLDKEWKYIACYKIGQIASMPNNWVQDFGK